MVVAGGGFPVGVCWCDAVAVFVVVRPGGVSGSEAAVKVVVQAVPATRSATPAARSSDGRLVSLSESMLTAGWCSLSSGWALSSSVRMMRSSSIR